MDADEVVPHHVKMCSEYSEATRQNLKAELNMPYGANKAKMDIFYPVMSDQDIAPVIVYIHGGYWKRCSKDMYSFVSNSWTQAGCIVVVVGYNLAPEARMEEIITEIQVAVEYVANKFPKSKLFLCGHSAGAHLCAMMAVTNWKKDSLVPQAVHGMFLLSGIYDLVPIVNTDINDPLKLCEGSAARISPQRILKQTSPTIKCPTLVVVEEHASPEFIRQSKEFDEILKSHGVQCFFLQFLELDHFNLIENMINPDDQLCKEILKLVQEK